MHPEQRLLVTGGTGSFGKTMLRRILDLPDTEAPGKVIIFSRDEEKQFHQRQEFPDPRIEYFIGDVRDRESCVKALKNVDIVIHAAALKQVPTGEFFPSQMVKTNVLGTENMLEAAEAQGVQKFINLSTDKAVYPINAYGMSKALGQRDGIARLCDPSLSRAAEGRRHGHRDRRLHDAVPSQAGRGHRSG
jgi:UDP-glucose 4-epimerase